MPTSDRPPAQSLYRQVRLTFTQELSGACSVSVYAKGLHDDWKENHCLLRTSVPVDAPLRSTEDVLSAVAVILESLLLPR